MISVQRTRLSLLGWFVLYWSGYHHDQLTLDDKHPDTLVTADPGAVNYIFSKNTYNYHHSPVFQPLIERIIGRG